MTSTGPDPDKRRRRSRKLTRTDAPDVVAKLKPAEREPDPDDGVTSPPFVGLGRLFREAHVVFNRLFTARLANHGITFGQFQHLQYLWGCDGITQVELAARIGIQPAVSTAILLSLEENGYIKRIRSLTDRRKVNLYLTARGIVVQKPLVDCVKEANDIAREGMSEDEIKMLVTLVDRVVGNLKNDNTAPAVETVRRKAKSAC